MSKRGGVGRQSERERARNAVVPQLYTVFGDVLSEQVIDMIAKSCDYDLDACMVTLSDMVTPAATVPHPAPQPAVPAPAPAPVVHHSDDGWEQIPPELLQHTATVSEQRKPAASKHQPATSSQRAQPPGFAAAPSASASASTASTQPASSTPLHIPSFASAAATPVPAQSNAPVFVSSRGSASAQLKSAIALAAAEAAQSVAASVASKPNGPSQRGIHTFLQPHTKKQHAQHQQQQQQQQAHSSHPPRQPASAWAKPQQQHLPRVIKQPWSKAVAVDSSQQQQQQQQQRVLDDDASNYRYTGPTLSRGHSIRTPATPPQPEAADSTSAHSVDAVEAGYDSDANAAEDIAAIKLAVPPPTSILDPHAHTRAYTYTGFETQPYFDMLPRLQEAWPKQCQLPSVPTGTVLDPDAPSAAQLVEEAVTPVEGIDAASPAHPSHALHALYLHLNADNSNDTAPQQGVLWKHLAGDSFAAIAPASTLFPAGSSSSSEQQLPEEEMTPAQALAWQQQQAVIATQQRKEQAAWAKQHEVDKQKVRARGAQTAPTDAEQRAAEREEAELAEALRAVEESEQMARELEQANLSAVPSDIPSLPPLTPAQRAESQESLVAQPAPLIAFLSELFAADVDPAVVRAVAESVLASAPRLPDARGSGVRQRELGYAEELQARDVAQECIDTLLAIVEEERDSMEEQEEAADYAAFAAAAAHMPASSPAGKQPRGGKAWRKQQAAEAEAHSAASALGEAPFVAAPVQLTDAEIAARMAVDPNFDPASLAISGDALTHALRASAPAPPVQRNKRGHVVVNRAALTPNYWSASAAASTPGSLGSVAPDLGAQWKLQALRNAFPLVDADLVEQAFVANAHSFERAREHLTTLFPTALANPHARPVPVHTPWAQSQQHHSKVISTSAADAARGIVTDARKREPGTFDVSERVEAASGGLSDADLEATLGPLLDGGVAGPVAVGDVDAESSSLRALADVHSARRRAYFSAAANAFARNQGAVAAQLASQGRQERSELHRAHGAAVLSTFVSHNHASSVRAGDGSSVSLDFHGLRVAEAVRILAFVMARQRRRVGAGGGAPPTLHVITGVGHHSQQGRARLQPALLAYLRQQGVSCSTTTAGVIQINLSR